MTLHRVIQIYKCYSFSQLIFIVVIQNVNQRGFHGIVRQGAHLNLVLLNLPRNKLSWKIFVLQMVTKTHPYRNLLNMFKHRYIQSESTHHVLFSE
jgi:hypothetical protein